MWKVHIARYDGLGELAQKQSQHIGNAMDAVLSLQYHQSINQCTKQTRHISKTIVNHCVNSLPLAGWYRFDNGLHTNTTCLPLSMQCSIFCTSRIVPASRKMPCASVPTHGIASISLSLSLSLSAVSRQSNCQALAVYTMTSNVFYCLSMMMIHNGATHHRRACVSDKPNRSHTICHCDAHLIYNRRHACRIGSIGIPHPIVIRNIGGAVGS
jgi:hypothetical protein